MAGVSDCLRCTNVTRNKKVKINKLAISKCQRTGARISQGGREQYDTKNYPAIGNKGIERRKVEWRDCGDTARVAAKDIQRECQEPY